VKHFTTADGLAAGDFLAAFCDQGGTLWFGTQKGLSRFTPEADSPVTPPPILVTGLLVAGERHRVSALGETEIKLPDLAAAQNQLQIDFVALGFAPGEVLQYQYRFEGVDSDWSTPTSQRNVNFAGLSPGSYKFLVRALNSEGGTSPVPAMITFTILRPVWQRWWFVSLAALAIAGFVYSLYRYRVSRLLEVADMRMRIATDLHDDIGANLTKIAILSEVVRQQLGANGAGLVDGPLSSIARISRESAASMSDIVWAINPRRDQLLDLVRRMREHAEEVFALREVDLRFEAPDALHNLKLGVNVRRDLLLIFKEAINNAARHSRCSQIRIILGLENSLLSLVVSDDGEGFNTNADSRGHGLANLKLRTERLGGKLDVESRRGEGTTVTCVVPLVRSALVSL
jgi:two-component sensor histidine kinase